MNWIIMVLMLVLPLIVPMYIGASIQSSAQGEQLYALWIIALSLITLNVKIVFDWFKSGKNGKNGEVLKKDIYNLNKCMEHLVNYQKRTEKDFARAVSDIRWLKEREIEVAGAFRQMAENSLRANLILEGIQKGIEVLNTSQNQTVKILKEQ